METNLRKQAKQEARLGKRSKESFFLLLRISCLFWDALLHGNKTREAGKSKIQELAVPAKTACMYCFGSCPAEPTKVPPIKPSAKPQTVTDATAPPQLVINTNTSTEELM